MLGMCQVDGFVSSTDATVWIFKMGCGARDNLFVAGLWWLWRWRNNMVFGEELWSLHSVVQKVRLSHDEFLAWYPSKKVTHQHRNLTVHWEPPPKGYVKLNTDGSFLESSSAMGTGGLIRSEEGEWFGGFSSSDGAGDMLLAEVLAVLHGLNLA